MVSRKSVFAAQRLWNILSLSCLFAYGWEHFLCVYTDEPNQFSTSRRTDGTNMDHNLVQLERQKVTRRVCVCSAAILMALAWFNPGGGKISTGDACCGINCWGHLHDWPVPINEHLLERVLRVAKILRKCAAAVLSCAGWKVERAATRVHLHAKRLQSLTPFDPRLVANKIAPSTTLSLARSLAGCLSECVLFITGTIYESSARLLRNGSPTELNTTTAAHRRARQRKQKLS